jgi:hypothetical protein
VVWFRRSHQLRQTPHGLAILVWASSFRPQHGGKPVDATLHAASIVCKLISGRRYPQDRHSLHSSPSTLSRALPSGWMVYGYRFCYERCPNRLYCYDVAATKLMPKPAVFMEFSHGRDRTLLNSSVLMAALLKLTWSLNLFDGLLKLTCLVR